jgi:hypothetical protein
LLEPKEPKIQGEKPYPFFLYSKSLRNATKKNVYRSFSPKSAAPLPACEIIVKETYLINKKRALNSARFNIIQ